MSEEDLVFHSYSYHDQTSIYFLRDSFKSHLQHSRCFQITFGGKVLSYLANNFRLSSIYNNFFCWSFRFRGCFLAFAQHQLWYIRSFAIAFAAELILLSLRKKPLSEIFSDTDNINLPVSFVCSICREWMRERTMEWQCYSGQLKLQSFLQSITKWKLKHIRKLCISEIVLERCNWLSLFWPTINYDVIIFHSLIQEQESHTLKLS